MGSRTRSYSGASRNERGLSPLPTLRSFGRPKARGISTTRDPLSGNAGAGGVSPPAQEKEDSTGGRIKQREGATKTGADNLGGVLGTRVMFVQLEGLDALEGG